MKHGGAADIRSRAARCLPRLCGGLIEAAVLRRCFFVMSFVSPAYAGASLKQRQRRRVVIPLLDCLPRLCGGLIEAPQRTSRHPL